jgi:uncharacterized damage-inducible protein DinB
MSGQQPARIEPAYVAGEREMLVAWLDYERATLALKCEGLDDGSLRERAVRPSTLSLLGLVRHMAEVERNWFRRVLVGEDAAPIYFDDVTDPDGDFDHVDDADVADCFATWRAECLQATANVAAAASLDVTGTRANGDVVSLRWIMVHMIEEYARHNGHADLLRERIDGVVGE